MKSPLGRIELGNLRPHYQDKLGELVLAIKPAIVVETGVWMGLSSEYILAALDANGAGHLYSIDPMDGGHVTNGLSGGEVAGVAAAYDANPIVHPRHTLIKKLSTEALPELAKEIGPVSMFIHDSDHGYDCQTFEYEWAFQNVKSGGIIVSDDPFWGEPAHNAWVKFLQRHNMGPAHVMGNAQWAVRP